MPNTVSEPTAVEDPGTHDEVVYLSPVGRAHDANPVLAPRTLELPDTQTDDTNCKDETTLVQTLVAVLKPKAVELPAEQSPDTHFPATGSLHALNTVSLPMLTELPVVHI